MGKYKGTSRRTEAVTNREMGALEGCREEGLTWQCSGALWRLLQGGQIP